MSKSNTAVKKNRHLIAITIIVILSCLIVVAATGIGVTVVAANGKQLSFSVDGQPVASIRVTSKEEVVLPTPEQKDGYTFSGWYFDKDTFTEPCTEETLKDKKFKSGTSVHAKWLKNDYTITYNLDSGENAKTNPNGYVVDTATIALVNPFKLGFTFDGWYSEDTFTTKVTEIAAGSTGDKTLFAKWIKNEFSIIYKSLEGATNNALNPGGYDVTTATIALADPSRVGYTFDGWYSEDTYKTKVTEITTGSTGDKTLFARWKAIEYGIVYHLNGGVNAIANPNTYTIDNAAAIAAPTREGYTFEGWYAKADFSGNAITEIAKGSTDVKTLFAKWSLTNYTINYELNGQVVTNPNEVVNYDIFTSTITLKDAIRNGYTFEGWYDANVGGNAVTEITKGSTGNKTVFARWKVVEYTITYNLDGGENSLANLSKYTIESDTIVFDTPTKAGYTFEGWYDAKAVANSFDNIMTGSTGNAKVYARWTASIYSVAYILTDANNDHGNITLYKASDSKQTLKKPTSKKNWLEFVGWFDAPTGGNQVTTIGGGALGNLTLYDRWDFVGTPNLAWNLAESDTVWEVARGGATGAIGIPGKHGNDGFPVRIKENGFKGATGITSVIIDDGVTSMGNYAFSGCTALVSVIMPDTVETMGIQTFYGCSVLKNVKLSNKLASIASQTFDGCAALVSVEIPNNVKIIESYAFRGTALKSVDIPKDVTSIKEHAFNSCTALKSVDIPSKVTSIGASAFSICSNLASIYIPKSVDIMGATVFGGCGRLTIYCEIAQAAVPNPGWQANWYGGDVDPSTEIKWGQILSTDGLIYKENGANYKVTGSVGLSGAVTIPATFNNRPVTSIGEMAFYAQKGITSVVIPDSVTTIGAGAFYACQALTSVNIPSGVTRIEYNTFRSTAITSVVIPEGVTIIGSSAFYDCQKLTSVNIPGKVENLMSESFRNCAKLSTIFIPTSVTTIGSNVFIEDPALTIYCERPNSTGMTLDGTWNNNNRPVVWGKVLSEDGFIYVSDGVEGYTVTGHNNPTGALVIPEKFNGRFVTGIGANAFQNKTAITSVVIPDSVTSMGENAFYGCTKLANAKLPSKLTNLAAYTFDGCAALTSIDIPNGVTVIGDYAFRNCTVLKSVKLPNELLTIGVQAFISCDALTRVELPSKVTTIGINAFNSCDTLTSINIPSSVTTILSTAFYNCVALTGIYIPKTVTTIGSNAFIGCTKIRIHCEAEVAPDYNSGDSSGWYSSGTTYWRGDVSTNYIRWNQIPSEDGYFYQLNADDTYTVSGHINSTDALVIPETFNKKNVTTIADYAFFNQKGLISVVIPSKVTSIGHLAFQECAALVSVTIPEGMITIDYQAFYVCQSLTYINIPSTVTSIGSHAFGSCPKIIRVFIPKSVERVYINAFYDCTTTKIYCEIAQSEATSPNWDVKWAQNVPAANILWSQTLSADGLIYEAVNVGGVDSYRVTGCDKLSGEVVIPEKFNGRPVTSIGYKAFFNQADITSVVIPKGVTSIGEQAFMGCTKLANVVIPEGVKTLDTQAFQYCEKLTVVTLPSTLLTINANAFYGCKLLSTINIPSMVETIGSNTFNSCVSLTNIYIPYSVITIGSNTFYNCPNIQVYCERTGRPGNWYFDNTNGVYWNGNTPTDKVHWGLIPSGDGWFYKDEGIGGYTVGGGINLVGEVSIPSVFNGRAVSKIDYKAFIYQKQITSIVIPDTVTTIGGLAFFGCSALKSIVIPDSVTSISTQCFQLCTSLTSVVIPDSVTSIRDYAFTDCTSLTSVNIPNRVTTIETRTFSGCSSLTSIFVPKSVTSVGDYAFYGCSKLLIYVEINSFSSGTDWQTGTRGYLSSQSISEDGLIFQLNGDAYNVSGSAKVSGDIVIPSSFNGKIVNEIRTDAFKGYVGITSVTIPDSVTKIGNYAFSGCSALKSVKMASGVQTIGTQAFYDCSALTSVNITNSVTLIGTNAFMKCTSLPKIFIPKSVTTIAQDVFYGCTSLKVYCETLSKPSGWGTTWYGNDYVVDPSTDIKWGQILAEDGSICQEDGKGGYIFNGSLDVSADIVIPGTLYGRPVSIGDSVFFDNTGITSVVIQNGVTSIGKQAFHGCSALKSVVIPSSVTSIKSSAFTNCSSLASINIPNGVTSIGFGVFLNCAALTSIVIPDSMTSIGESAFYSCSSLTSVVIPNSVTTIEIATFSGCKALTSVVIPNSVTTIGESAFSSCASLKSVVIPSSVTSIGEYVFFFCTSLASVDIPNGVKTIEAGTFYGCKNLKSVVIPNSVTSIGTSSFNECKNLTSVVIPNSVTTIEANTFVSCQSLTSIVIPDSVTSIGVEAFYYCTSLMSVNIPSSVTTIGSQAFRGCSALTSIYIPSSVTTIGVNAFDSCKNITISCQAASKPNGWDAKWMGNVKDTNITWGAPVPAVKP